MITSVLTMRRQLISFRIEDTIVNWLKKREAETGKYTPDFLRDILWSIYSQELQQKVGQKVSNKFYENELKEIEKDIKTTVNLLSSPDNQKQLAEMMLRAKLSVDQSGLFNTLFNKAKTVKRNKRMRRSKEHGTLKEKGKKE